MARVGTNERMDDPNVDPTELDDALRFIRRVNRRHGGLAAATTALARIAQRIPATETIRVLDVATGSADIPLALARWARGASRQIDIVAVDNHPHTLNHAQDYLAEQEPELSSRITLQLADARRLTDNHDPKSFHITHCAMFLHHLPEVELLTILRIMDRLASHAVVATDLLNTPISNIAIKLMTLTSSAMIKHDARVSVANGFSVREAREIAKRVGLERPKVTSSFLAQRFTLVSEKMA